MDYLVDARPGRFVPMSTEEGRNQSVGYFQGTFEQMQALGLINEAEVTRMVGSLSAQQQMLDPCRELRDKPDYDPGFDLLSADTYALVTENVTNAGKVLLGRVLLENEIVLAFNNENLTTQQVPLLNQMVPNMDEWPRNLTFRWNNIGFQMLGQSATVLDAASLLIVKQFRKVPGLTLTAAQYGDKDTLAITQSTVSTLNDPRNAIDKLDIPQSTIAMHKDTYRQWQEVSGLLADYLAFMTDEIVDAVWVARKRETDEKVGVLTVELAQVVATHTEQTNTFRPNWSMLERKAGLRPFYNKVLHASRTETAPLAIATAQDAKRLTGVLHTLERLGSNPDQLSAHMKRLITQEHAASENIHRTTTELTKLGANPDADWQPVRTDIAFIQANWPTIIDIVRDHWKPGVKHTTTAQSIEAMHRALAAYRHEDEIIGTER